MNILKMNGYSVCGFFDDIAKKDNVSGLKWLGSTDVLQENISNYVCCIGNIIARRRVVECNRGVKWMAAVHPSAIISEGVEIGSGSVVCAHCTIEPGVTIGDHCIINTNCSINHDSEIGSFVNVSPGCTLCGHVTVGNDVFVGAGSTIINNIRIGDGAIIGAGSTVLRDISPHTLAFGTPCREQNRL
jgi:acetyltransferase EpsM